MPGAAPPCSVLAMRREKLILAVPSALAFVDVDVGLRQLDQHWFSARLIRTSRGSRTSSGWRPAAGVGLSVQRLVTRLVLRDTDAPLLRRGFGNISSIIRSMPTTHSKPHEEKQMEPEE